MNKVFITTAIPYVNAKPHIGFALELIQADTLARYYREKLGEENIFFLNGTDEHGSKIEKTAKEKGVKPEEYVDEISKLYINLGQELNISNNDFIRTSGERHKKSATQLWELCKKDIYKKSYQGFYCTGCEEFKTERDLLDGKCPTHGVEVELVKEENYFFALSKYAGEIEKLIREDKLKIVPEIRKNEVLNWLKEGVEDVSISRERKKLTWGISVPNDSEQTMYVWVDALSNYLTGAGFPEDKYKNWWNEETTKIHIIGKDILRFHALIWPGLLLSAGLPLPNIIYAHGFITSNNQKMSKSLGNVIDPLEISKKYGVDALRYYLLAKVPWDNDGDFTIDKFKLVYKGELADNWGNLINRVVTLANKLGIDIEKDSSDVIASDPSAGNDEEIKNFKFNLYIEKSMKVLADINKEINEKKPWELITSNPNEAKKLIESWLEKVINITKDLSYITPEIAKKVENIYQTKDLVQLFPRID